MLPISVLITCSLIFTLGVLAHGEKQSEQPQERISEETTRQAARAGKAPIMQSEEEKRTEDHCKRLTERKQPASILPRLSRPASRIEAKRGSVEKVPENRRTKERKASTSDRKARKEKQVLEKQSIGSQNATNSSTSGGDRSNDIGVFKITAYTAGVESTGKQPGDEGYGITADGSTVREGITVAADPAVIPLGTVVYIDGIGQRTVQDTGGGVKGNHLDIYINNLDQAMAFGVQKAAVHVISWGGSQ
ncbi:3D domain-containing protein [Bacillus velezensis]|uniref:3D domain-containing protein n=1 Tax=Bacillus velezensis TaxID=492670 RepID=UPI003745C598